MNTLVFDLGGTKCDAGLFDGKGKLLKKARILTSSEKGRAVVLQQLVDLAEEFLADFKIGKCVIGVPGRTDDNQETVIKMPNIAGFENFNLAKFFQTKFPQMQCLIENDAVLFALGAFQSLNAKPEIFVGITLGTGIGGGVIVNGKLIRGKDFLAGEFGHMVIESDGLKCHCGQKGCFETYASASALLQKIENYLQENPKTETVLPRVKITMNEVAEALVRKDEFVFKMLNEVVDYLAIGLANVMHSIDPEIIALGGSLGNLLPYYKDNLKTKVEARLLGKVTKCKFLSVQDSDVQLRGGLFL